jgi:hypothetical protein
MDSSYRLFALSATSPYLKVLSLAVTHSFYTFNFYPMVLDNGVYYEGANQDIAKVSTTTGTTTPFVGLYGKEGSIDGVGTNARFSNIASLDIDNNGYIYVSDITNQLIRIISKTGVVKTLAGIYNKPKVTYGLNGSFYYGTELYAFSGGRQIVQVVSCSPLTIAPAISSTNRESSLFTEIFFG